ncbi:Disease resistance protein RPM1 [Hordeum vulgare]|nr:Disease resistance protein RPM1 [Hordeum vulgare]
MTMTLEDVSMITALPIERKPLCISTDSEGWRDQMEALIGMSPPDPEVEDGGKKDRVLAGASFTWIAPNFAHCPKDANNEVIQTYARVYMWYVISRTIFADGTGKNAPWLWLKAFTVFDNKFSWGSAALAYLYRQKQGQKLRRLSNILGCRDPEYSEPSRFGSSHRNTLDDSTSLGARMDNGDITLGAHLEDDVDTPEVQDGMMLKDFKRSTYMLKPRKGIKRYTPEDYENKGKNPVAVVSRMIKDMTRLRGMDDEDDDHDELHEPQPVVRRKKLASKRGRGHKQR